MKPILWLGSSKEDLKKMSSAIREDIGYQLYKLQNGVNPNDFKPFPGIGAGVYEIRVRDENNKNVGRCFYVAKIEEKIIVLHCFIKKTQQTSIKDIELAKERLRRFNHEKRI